MINFPTLCVDNFYNDPDAVRDFALSQEFYSSKGNYPGQRTKQLHELNRELFDRFCSSLFSIFYPTEEIRWNVDTSFWKVGTLDSDPLSPKNMGVIHQDHCWIFAGVIYLTPGLDKSLGTTIYKKIDEKPANDEEFDAFTSFYLNGEDKGFDKAIITNNKRYEETARFDNVFNRLICFDGTVPHSPSNYYMKDQIRLNQVFFVNKVDSTSPSPMHRIRSNNV